MKKMSLNIQLFATEVTPTKWYDTDDDGRSVWTGSYGGGSKRFQWGLRVEINNQNITTNKTLLDLALWEYGTWGSYSGQHATYVELHIRVKNSNGTWGSWTRLDRQKSPRFDKGAEVDQLNATYTIEHNADGSCPIFQVKGVCDTSNSQSWSPVDCTVTSAELYCKTIPRASIINSASVTRNSITFNYTKYTTSFTDKVKIYAGDKVLFEDFIPTSAVVTNSAIRKDFNQTIFDKLTQRANALETIYVPITIETRTYNGSTPIGSTTTKDVTYIIPAATLNSTTSIDVYDTDMSITPNLSTFSSSGFKYDIECISGSSTLFPLNNVSHNTAKSFGTSYANLVFNKFTSKNSSVSLTFKLITKLTNGVTVGSAEITKDISLPSYSLVGTISATEANSAVANYKSSSAFIKGLSTMSLTFQAGKGSSSGATSFFNRTIGYRLNNNSVTSPATFAYNGTAPSVIASTGLGDDVSLSPSVTYIPYEFPYATVTAIRCSDAQGNNPSQVGAYIKFLIRLVYFRDKNSLLINKASAPTFTVSYTGDGTGSFNQSTANVSYTDDDSTYAEQRIRTYKYVLGGRDYNNQLSFTVSATDLISRSITQVTDKVIPGRPGMYGYKDSNAKNHTVINDYFDIDGTFGDTLKQLVFDTVFPIGSIYMTVDPSLSTTTAMHNKFGGSWTKLENKFLVGAGSSYSLEATGGHTSQSYTPSGSISGTKLTEDDIPIHNHGAGGAISGWWKNVHSRFPGTSQADGTLVSLLKQSQSTYWSSQGDTANNTVGFNINIPNHTHSNYGKSDAERNAHNHSFSGNAASISTVPPYIAVYIYKRTG